jgi:hypothetical protein
LFLVQSTKGSSAMSDRSSGYISHSMELQLQSPVGEEGEREDSRVKDRVRVSVRDKCYCGYRDYLGGGVVKQQKGGRRISRKGRQLKRWRDTSYRTALYV